MKIKNNHSPVRQITLAGGCFWCIEAIYKRVKGVISSVPGYAGGHVPDPTYEEVSTGMTGHAEAVQITFDSRIISLEKILKIYWCLHDPTTLNRQGDDVGPQYRSAIFYSDEEQRQQSERSKHKLEKSGMYPDPPVTEIIPLNNFYPAAEEHYDFYEKHRGSSYCRLVIDPKIAKLYQKFSSDLKAKDVKEQKEAA